MTEHSSYVSQFVLGQLNSRCQIVKFRRISYICLKAGARIEIKGFAFLTEKFINGKQNENMKIIKVDKYLKYCSGNLNHKTRS